MGRSINQLGIVRAITTIIILTTAVKKISDSSRRTGRTTGRAIVTADYILFCLSGSNIIWRPLAQQGVLKMLSAQIPLVVVIDSFQLLEQNGSLSSRFPNLCLLLCNNLELFILMHVKTSKLQEELCADGKVRYSIFPHVTDMPKITAQAWQVNAKLKTVKQKSYDHFSQKQKDETKRTSYRVITLKELCSLSLIHI